MLKDKGDIRDLIKKYEIPVVGVKDVCHDGVDNLVSQISALKGEEGIVIRFNDGHMLKIKAADYVRIHKAKERVTEERHVVEDILDDKLDDVIAAVLPDDRERLTKYRDQFLRKVNISVLDLSMKIVARHLQFPNRKDYALSKEQKGDTKFETRAIFWFYDLRGFTTWDLYEYVVASRIRPALGTRTKFGEMKNEIFPNQRFIRHETRP